MNYRLKQLWHWWNVTDRERMPFTLLYTNKIINFLYKNKPAVKLEVCIAFENKQKFSHKHKNTDPRRPCPISSNIYNLTQTTKDTQQKHAKERTCALKKKRFGMSSKMAWEDRWYACVCMCLCLSACGNVCVYTVCAWVCMYRYVHTSACRYVYSVWRIVTHQQPCNDPGRQPLGYQPVAC